jgi:hypothetical protein
VNSSILWFFSCSFMLVRMLHFAYNFICEWISVFLMKRDDFYSDLISCYPDNAWYCFEHYWQIRAKLHVKHTELTQSECWRHKWLFGLDFSKGSSNDRLVCLRLDVICEEGWGFRYLVRVLYDSKGVTLVISLRFRWLVETVCLL